MASLKTEKQQLLGLKAAAALPDAALYANVVDATIWGALGGLPR